MYSLGKQTLFLILQAFNLNNKGEVTLRNLIRPSLPYVCVCVRFVRLRYFKIIKKILI